MAMGPLMIDIAGLTLSAADEQLLKHPLVGGVILFSRNFASIAQLQKLVYSIRKTRKDPILIAVDHEGGRVQRFQHEFTRLPPCGVFEKLYQKHQQQALDHASTMGWLMASELLAVGIDLSFAPVLDINNPHSEVMFGRGFHQQPAAITALAEAYITGMHRAGMACTGKHFPGHGSVNLDSHKVLPIDERTMADIVRHDLHPFASLSMELDAMMMAHVVYPEVDDKPASFSRRWVTDILRDDLCFDGVIFSDDLTMLAADGVGSYPQRAEQALQAGCDMILLCNHREAVYEVIAAVGDYHDPLAHQRLIKLCGYFNLAWDELRLQSDWKHGKRIAHELLALGD